MVRSVKIHDVYVIHLILMIIIIIIIIVIIDDESNDCCIDLKYGPSLHLTSENDADSDMVMMMMTTTTLMLLMMLMMMMLMMLLILLMMITFNRFKLVSTCCRTLAAPKFFPSQGLICIA